MIRFTLAGMVGLGLLFSAGLSQAGVITATSGAYADVSAAVSKASPGDTVSIPPGQYTWTQSLNISGITLLGSGTNQTIIVDETPITGNGLPIFNLSTSAATLTRLAQLTVTVGSVNTYPTVSVQAGNAAAAVRGNINVYGTNLFRIDHCVFHYLTGKPIHVTSMNYGLIDHCSFEMYGGANAIEVDGGVDSDGGLGDYSWSIPYAYGSSNALFIEDNYISSAMRFTAIDVANGGRAVIRNNFFQGSFIYTHGTESGQRTRSVRVVEVYSNTINYSQTVFDNGSAAITIRGGTGLIFNNSVVNFYNVVSLQDYRTTDNSPAFTPWFGATGLRGYDSNSPALLTGVAASTTNNLVVAGANWTNNQFYGCTVYNPNNQLCGIVTANNTNTMWFLSSAAPQYQLHFTTGDAFVVHMVYPKIDQPGRGYGDLVTGDVPAAVWPHQVSEPIYLWNNSLSRNYIPTSSAGWGNSAYPDIAEGRDFINSTMPGYKPFMYPHPLTLITDAVVNTNSVTVTNSPAPILTPPTGLNVRPL
jgi:hypothetical protein